MARKYRTAKERKKRNRTIALCIICGLLVLTTVLIVVGVTLGRKADEEEKISYEYLKKALEAVEAAEVSHESGTAVVTLSAAVGDEVLKNAVEAQDYKVLGIE